MEIYMSGEGASAATIGERIRAIRAAKKMTQSQFAKSLGVVQGFLCSIEKGRKLPSETLLIALQYLYGINKAWLDSGDGDIFMQNNHSSPPVHTISTIPLYSSPPGSAESMPSNDLTDQILLPEVPEGCFAFVYSGDFMSPTIRDSDLVIVKPDSQPSSGDIILITGQWGDSFLRRFRKKGGEVFCSADNSSYSSFKPDSNTKIIGTVHSVWRRVRI